MNNTTGGGEKVAGGSLRSSSPLSNRQNKKGFRKEGDKFCESCGTRMRVHVKRQRLGKGFEGKYICTTRPFR